MTFRSALRRVGILSGGTSLCEKTSHLGNNALGPKEMKERQRFLSKDRSLLIFAAPCGATFRTQDSSAQRMRLFQSTKPQAGLLSGPAARTAAPHTAGTFIPDVLFAPRGRERKRNHRGYNELIFLCASLLSIPKLQCQSLLGETGPCCK